MDPKDLRYFRLGLMIRSLLQFSSSIHPWGIKVPRSSRASLSSPHEAPLPPLDSLDRFLLLDATTFSLG
jgi:hypothetical protein